MATPLTPATMRFLRGLAKHNDRLWFEERRALYEQACKAPMLGLIDAINLELADFAPEYVRPAHKIAMRIYRDIRFSPDKRPYKHNLAAWWARQGFEKHDRAGFYVQVGPPGSFAVAGVYAPQREDLLALRRWLAEHHDSYQDALAPLLKGSRKFPALEPLEPNALTRNPKGFPADHPAGEVLRPRNWGVRQPFTEEQVLGADFSGLVAGLFRRTAPFVNLLNGAFAASDPARPRAQVL